MTLPSKPDVTRRRVLVSYSMFFTQLAWPCNEQTFEFSFRRSHNAIVVSSEQVANKRLSKNLRGTDQSGLIFSADINLDSSLIPLVFIGLCTSYPHNELNLTYLTNKFRFKGSCCHLESFYVSLLWASTPSDPSLDVLTLEKSTLCCWHSPRGPPSGFWCVWMRSDQTAGPQSARRPPSAQTWAEQHTQIRDARKHTRGRKSSSLWPCYGRMLCF